MRHTPTAGTLLGAMCIGASVLCWYAFSGSALPQEGAVQLPSGADLRVAIPAGGEAVAKVPNGLEIVQTLRLEARPVSPRLKLPAGACRMQADAEGNVEGDCALPPQQPAAAMNSPFGPGRWAPPGG